MASGKPYVFRPFHHDFCHINMYRQTAYKVTERQYSVFIGSLCDGECGQFYCGTQKAHSDFNSSICTSQGFTVLIVVFDIKVS